MMMVVVVMLLLLLLRWDRAFCAHRCARCGLLHLEVKNFLRYHAEPILCLWRWQPGTRLARRLALDGIHWSVKVNLWLTIVEINGGKLNFVDARKSGGVHLQGV
jgi:hypothetical protein